MMRVVDLHAEYQVSWLIRELPTAVLRAVVRDDLAAAIVALPVLTASTVDSWEQLERCLVPLRHAALELASVGADEWPPRWELDAFIYAEIGPEIHDYAHEIAREVLLTHGTNVGFWALRVLREGYLINPSATTAFLRQSYQAFFDRAVLDGYGRLELPS
ncbi:hypothetical protein [Nocardia salmonicida]|uniref:hypothetical protein n=1 Tax=Nocardia salmonicida TaxID=53431 RepID=UPI0037932A35